jgi:putative acetyltransferase
MHKGEISIDDPRAGDVQKLLAKHLEFAHLHTPPEGVFALGTADLLEPGVTFFSFREGGELLAVGALKQLDGHHAELKSMHTAQAARGRGIGRAMVDHLVGVARGLGCHRVSLETGTMAAFAPARALYRRAGFTECGPFAAYQPAPTSTFMTLALAGPSPAS